MMVVLVSLLFIMIFFLGIAYRQADIQQGETGRRLDSLCTEIAAKIGNAIFYGPGFSQNVTLNPTLYGTNYNITIYNNAVTCDSSNYNSIKNFENVDGFNVSNGIVKAPFNAPFATLRIRNDDKLGIVISP